MNRWQLAGLAAVASLVVLPQRASAQEEWLFFDVPGATHTRPFVITPRGDIAGLFIEPDGRVRGFVLDDGGFTTIDVPGANFTNVVGMNPAGALVGWYWVTAGAFHGYLFSDGVFTTIDVPGAARTFASGINGDGDIVGHFVDAAGVNHGFLLRGGVFEVIDVPDARLTQAVDINARGDILGAFQGADFRFHMFVLSAEGELTVIDYPGAQHTGAPGVGLGINPGGSLVGQYRQGGGVYGFVLDAEGYWPIVVPGATQTVATGINPQGAIVGRYRDAAGSDHGFILHR